MSGLFITLEGGDGAGKTTQADLLSSWLNDRGFEVVRTREPGGTELGLALREILLHGGHIHERTEALLYAADRAQHVAEVVRPALARGAAVVQDRYIDSSLAYQGAGRPLPPSEIRQLSEWASEGLWPRLTILLDVSPEMAASRREAAGQPADRLESEATEFHRRVREGFLSLASEEPHRFLVLDAVLPVEEVHALIISHLEPLLDCLSLACGTTSNSSYLCVAHELQTDYASYDAEQQQYFNEAHSLGADCHRVDHRE